MHFSGKPPWFTSSFNKNILEVKFMKKKVIYNGGHISKRTCSDPIVLELGKIYTVDSTRDRGGLQTDYTLEGVIGEFASDWLDDVSELQTYFAVSKDIPEEGKCFEFDLLDIDNGIPYIKEHKFVNYIKYVEVIGNNTYKTISGSVIYIVAVK